MCTSLAAQRQVESRVNAVIPPDSPCSAIQIANRAATAVGSSAAPSQASMGAAEKLIAARLWWRDWDGKWANPAVDIVPAPEFARQLSKLVPAEDRTSCAVCQMAMLHGDRAVLASSGVEIWLVGHLRCADRFNSNRFVVGPYPGAAARRLIDRRCIKQRRVAPPPRIRPAPVKEPARANSKEWPTGKTPKIAVGTLIHQKAAGRIHRYVVVDTASRWNERWQRYWHVFVVEGWCALCRAPFRQDLGKSHAKSLLRTCRAHRGRL